MLRNKKTLLAAILALAAVAILVLILALTGKGGEQPAGQTDPSGLQQTGPSASDPGAQDPQATLPEGQPPQQTDPAGTDPVHTEPGGTEPVQSEPTQTDPVQTDPVQTAPPPVTGPIEHLENSYEHWLSAAMVMATTLEYPQFELVGIYAASATDLRDPASSRGAYLLIRVDGQELLIHSKPLSGERTEKGTRDLFTAQLGFSTFDVVDRGSVELSKLREFDLTELSDMIAQSMLVTLYAR